MKLLAACMAWIAGIYLGYYLRLPWLIAPCMFAVWLLVRWRLVRHTALAWGGLCLVLALSGAVLCQARISGPFLPKDAYGEVEVWGELDRDPTSTAGSTSLSVKIERFRTEDGPWQEADARVLVWSGAYPVYCSGDRLSVTGVLARLDSLSDQDYAASLRDQGYRGTMQSPEISLIERGFLPGLRHDLSRALSTALSEPQTALAQALAIGDRTSIPPALGQAFRDSGISHIMAISGLHISMVGASALAAAGWAMGRRQGLYVVVALLLLWSYVTLSGMRPPAVRAGIMCSMTLAALLAGRKGNLLSFLALAAALMLAVSPGLLHDASFQLSFAAVGSVLILGPRLTASWNLEEPYPSPLHANLRKLLRGTVQALAVSLAATLGTYPLIAHHFGHISLVGIPATFVAVLALPATIALSLLVAFTGLALPGLAAALAWLAWPFLSLVVASAETFARLPGAGISTGPVSTAVVSTYYLAGAILLSHRRLWSLVKGAPGKLQDVAASLGERLPAMRPKFVAAPLLLVAVVVWAGVWALPDKDFRVAFLDVGQGDAIFIKTPDGKQVLIDGGPDPGRLCVELGKQMPFWDRSLDVLVLTHPESDHLTGLVEVLSRYKVGCVLDSGREASSTAYAEWLLLLEEKDVRRVACGAGTTITLGEGIVMEVLHPTQPVSDKTSLNDSSVVIRLSRGDVSFLLAGDIGAEVETSLLFRTGRLGSTVLKVAHHGSASSSCSRFIEGVAPEVAVISVGEGNSFGHPADEALQRLGSIPVYRTDKHGTITFTSDGSRLWVKTNKACP